MENLIDFEGKRILVTGASSGIGKETCMLLSRLGATVVLVARNQSRLESTKAHMNGTDHVILNFDLNEPHHLNEWFKTNKSLIGTLDGLVHCAGISYTQPLKFMKSMFVEETITVNLTSAIYLIQGFLQKGIRAPQCSVVLVSSVMGLVGQPAISAYSASKGGLISLTKSLALELAQSQVRINCVAPGYVQSEMMDAQKKIISDDQLQAIEKQHPLGFGKPLDVANSIIFLLSSMSSWITGTTLIVDGGYTTH
ncbi:MAG: SDR family oxidoreductase [SAR324 cluster bacterium]|nr:SDR family oxidoreductase [SAR324 cluster bacterium]